MRRPRSRRRLRASAHLIMLLSAARAGAQAVRPVSPDTTPPNVPSGGSLTFVRFLRAPEPYVASDGRFTFLLAAGTTATALDSVRVPAPRAACADSGTVRDYPRDTDRDPAAVSGRFLVLVVTGTQRGTTPCQIDWNLDPSSIWHGAFLAGQPTNGAREPLAARLVVDGTPLEPVMSYRRPAFRLAEQEWKREGEQLRYYYDMDVVRPRTDGRPHRLVLRTWGREPAPTTFEIEPGGARRLALGYVAWKLATVGPRSRDARRDIRPSSAMSPPVAAMLDSARTGLATAGLRAAVWASARADSASPSDGVARLLAAEALVSDGDVPLSASVVAGVLRDHPCLVPPVGSSTAIVEQAKARRAAEPCRPVSPLRAGALSVVPGLGSFVANDRRGAAIGAGLVAVAFARVLVFDSRAKQKYADYQASRTPAEVATMYEAVSDLRAQRGAALNVAAVVWALDALWAMHGAQSHDRRIANDRF